MFAVRTIQNQYIQNAALMTVKADGSYSYRSALKVNCVSYAMKHLYRDPSVV
jgi:hypothetical protein